MCLICVDIGKDKMTVEEGYRALTEMQAGMESEHIEEVEDLLYQKTAQEWFDLENWDELDSLESLVPDYFGTD